MKGADLYPWLVKMYKMKAQVLHADCGFFTPWIMFKV